ncbi:MAG: hypothetical protein IPH51_19565 [Rubrivivax sp.]|nr:hypothetical protein [Rubrivivax sp.]
MAEGIRQLLAGKGDVVGFGMHATTDSAEVVRGSREPHGQRWAVTRRRRSL